MSRSVAPLAVRGGLMHDQKPRIRARRPDRRNSAAGPGDRRNPVEDSKREAPPGAKHRRHGRGTTNKTNRKIPRLPEQAEAGEKEEQKMWYAAHVIMNVEF